MKALAVGLLLFSCIWASVSAQCASTQRTVTPIGGTSQTVHVFTAANWVSCIDASGMTFTAGEKTIATGLLDAVETAVTLHSFTDLSKSYSQSAPRNFSLQTDLLATLTNIRNKVNNDNTYKAIRFLDEVADTVNSALDAHLAFTRPTPLLEMDQIAPFGLMLARDGGNNVVVRIVNGTWMPADFTAAFGGDAFADLVDGTSTLMSVNGVPAVEFLRQWASQFGFSHRDPMTRLNAALGSKGNWARRPLNKYTPVFLSSPTLTYVVMKSGGSQVTRSIAHGIYGPTAINDVAFLKSVLFADRVGKRAAVSTESTQTVSKRALSLGGPSVQGVFSQYRTGAAGSGACVLRVETFFVAPGAATQNYRATLEEAITECVQLGYNNLIVDVSSNLGGAPAAAQTLAAMLVRPWDGVNNPNTNFDHPFQLFDIPVNSKWTELYNAVALNNTGSVGLWPFRNYLNPVDGTFLTPAGFLNGTSRSVGTIARTLSVPALFYGYPDLAGLTYSPVGNRTYFEKIIIVSNGVCGSSCGQFVNMLRKADRVRTVYIGGLPNEDADPASYAGGARFTYSQLRNQVPPAAQAALPALRMNGAEMEFNGWESYKSCASYLRGEAPADMFLGKADLHLAGHWEYAASPLPASVGLTDTDKALANALYDVILTYFPQMPVNLTQKTRSTRLPQLACADDAPFYPEIFSTTCVGEWVPLPGAQCNASCNGGFIAQRYHIYITGDGNCPFVNGVTRNGSCNTQPCPCRQETVRTTLCTESCTQTMVNKTLPNSGPCNTADGTVVATLNCFRENCLPTGRKPGELRGAILPIVHCIELTNAVSNPQKYTAYWGYTNEDSVSFGIPIGSGNKFTGFTPAADNKGQPATFLPGYNPFQFGVEFDDNLIPKWTVDSSMDANQNIIPSCPSRTGDAITIIVLLQSRNASTPFVSDTNGLLGCLKTDMRRTGDNVIVTDAFRAPGSFGIYQINITIAFDNLADQDPTPAAALLNMGKVIAANPGTYFTTRLAASSCANWASSGITASYIEIETRYNTKAPRPGTNGGLVPIGNAVPVTQAPNAAPTIALAPLAAAIFALGLFVQLFM